ncbi:hypothetical protein BC827DRAFT_1251797 [Russula dissimulans]|nr:hypothetical protein BC827DRAFT_1251797 [Russula dissimulans]
MSAFPPSPTSIPPNVNVEEEIPLLLVRCSFGNFEHLTSPYATVFDVPMTGTLVSLTVQCFFMYRILVLSKKQAWWLCVQFPFFCSQLSVQLGRSRRVSM